METETSPAGTPVEFRPLRRENWQRFFDEVTKLIEGSQVEIEIAGLDLGDQIQAARLPLNGLTYDPNDDTFYVYIEDVENSFDHAIPHPREILVHLVPEGLDQLVVLDPEGRRHIVRLRHPLQLPSQTE